MEELEVKAKLDEKKLGELLELFESECASAGVEEQVDTYYGHPCRDFAASDEALRIRVSRSSLPQLCYKGPRKREGPSFAKAREEVCVDVSSAELLRELLDRLGFFEVGTVRKKRLAYDCGDFFAFVDDVAQLGFFVELELKPGARKERLEELVSGFGLSESVVEKTYLEMLLELKPAS